MYKTASLVDTINVILSNNTEHDTSPFLPTLHMMDCRSKEEKDINLLLLVDEFGCSALPFVVKMIVFVDPHNSS